DLDVPVRIRRCPIVREADGLALSSRNQYLDPNQRRQAPVLWQALQGARGLIDSGERNSAVVGHAIMKHLAAAPDAVLDYAAIVNAETLQPIARLHGVVLIALAVKFGSTRLIDNLQLDVD
ncbi:MAG TPA: pantoate--beta-alanine ligase, partial [Gemmataceae bacterium]|nr:pantoate--beta-alanine ligase [Gemmataceae bacterium]